ncbi:MAG: hypothetical protein HGA28_08585 [Anaerolineaceae bacterium]|nr:hypothetical protein [Anaerolineaceae bacterium]
MNLDISKITSCGSDWETNRYMFLQTIRGWENEIRPFTFTNLPDDDYLQFTIKTYPSHKGVTNELLQLRKKDELILGEVFGAIEYAGEGYDVTQSRIVAFQLLKDTFDLSVSLLKPVSGKQLSTEENVIVRVKNVGFKFDDLVFPVG